MGRRDGGEGDRGEEGQEIGRRSKMWAREQGNPTTQSSCKDDLMPYGLRIQN
jgi:hypothetical protein